MDFYTKLAALQQEAKLEQRRCMLMEHAWASVDSEVADACHFDTGVLQACLRILRTIQRREEILVVIDAMIQQIAQANNERWEP